MRTKSTMSFTSGGRLTAALAVAAGLALLASACSGRPAPPKRSDALRGDALGLIVDSVVVPPFERGYGVQINIADLGVFRDQLEAQVVAPGRKAYPSSPTTLPNTVTLAATLLGYATREETADGMYLRTIDMVVQVRVFVGAEKDPDLKLIREYSYQKLYLTTQGVPPPDFDLHNAAREAVGVITRILVPGTPEAPTLEAAIDGASGKNYSHPLLVRGSRDAGFGRYDRAIKAWSLLLFNPAWTVDQDRFRVSERTLAHLEQTGVRESDLNILRPLAKRGPESLENLRDRVVRVLGPNSPLQPKVLQLSDENVDRIQINLSRAHYNLSSVYQFLHRYDVAAFHLARAYGYDPKPEYLNAWIELQMQRDVIPKNLQHLPADGLEWLRAYQRVPAPFTATEAGGTYDRTVMPALAFPPDATPLKTPPPSVSTPLPVIVPVAVPSAGKSQPETRGTPAQRRRYGQAATPRTGQSPAQRLGY